MIEPPSFNDRSGLAAINRLAYLIARLSIATGGMIVRISFGIALLTILNVLPVSSAEIERHATADKTVAISIAGEIVEGDAEAFRLEIQSAQLANFSIFEIQLNSIGGSLYEGTSLARVVRAASLNTSVAKRSICASACFLIFAAGSTKAVQNGARVGVHAATMASGDNNQIEIKATEAMGRIANLLGVPSGIVERMVSTPASQMFWLNDQSEEDARSRMAVPLLILLRAKKHEPNNRQSTLRWLHPNHLTFRLPRYRRRDAAAEPAFLRRRR
ncbi:ATP-dependent Clp protease proteolytic subunit [Bradyrhizobium sp. McL0615]|uniref:ATP-dependent Clp protease proteolytic subunit n=1 Tax=Bradyrhizobium sp. McL0615 TaxID=3415673 RepID=UPI003CE9D63D